MPLVYFAFDAWRWVVPRVGRAGWEFRDVERVSVSSNLLDIAHSDWKDFVFDNADPQLRDPNRFMRAWRWDGSRWELIERRRGNDAFKLIGRRFESDDARNWRQLPRGMQ